MKKSILFLSLFMLSIYFIRCKSEDKSTNFKAFTDEYFKEKCALNPLEATLNGQNKYNDQLVFEMTESYRKKKGAFFNKYLNELKNIDVASLSDEEKNSFGIIEWESKIGLDLLKQNANLTPINHFDSMHLTMGQLASGENSQPFKTEKDYQNFLKRIDLYTVWLDSAVVYMRKGMRQKVTLPKALTLKMIPQFEEMITIKADDNLFYSTLKKFPADFSEEQKKKLTKEYTTIILEKLIPKFQETLTFLKTEYLPASRTTSGIGSNSGGINLYQVYAKQWTTTDKTPEEIHELGLKEVARIKAEMEEKKNQVGFKGTINDFFENIRNKPELKPYKKPEEVLANFELIYQKIKPNVNELFALQPKTKFEIRRTEAFREKTASVEYIQGNADGSRPGIFYVPVPDVANYNLYSDENTFLHEAIPGHHFQLSLQRENTSLPEFRKFVGFGAFEEGWGLYAESLGTELGLYKDPYQYFGMLSWDMHRAIRLVVDTGIHTKGWTREQAIRYSLDNEAESEATITSEIERYMAIPGQALSYKIGQLKIIELKTKAKNKMGSNFDIKKFHQLILESGSMPLLLLENKINAWIDTKK